MGSEESGGVSSEEIAVVDEEKGDQEEEQLNGENQEGSSNNSRVNREEEKDAEEFLRETFFLSLIESDTCRSVSPVSRRILRSTASIKQHPKRTCFPLLARNIFSQLFSCDFSNK